MTVWTSLVVRDMRAGLSRLRLVAACLTLGVAIIAASGSLRAGLMQAITEDARILLGGDLDIRQSLAPVDDRQMQALTRLGQVSLGLEMRAMARFDGKHRLVELKGVDQAYPLVGRFDLLTGQDRPPSLGQALAVTEGLPGAVADPALAQGLGLSVGDVLQVGQARFRLTGLIGHEPDRVATPFTLGPRLMIDRDRMADTGLIGPAALVKWTARLVLAPGLDVAGAKASLARQFPDAFWQVRDGADAAPGLGRVLDTLSSFLTLVGLSALVLGGIGIAGAVKAHLDDRRHAIAVLKALGASRAVILASQGALIVLVALAGIAGGLVLGAAVPPLVAAWAGDRLPLAMRSGPFVGPLALSAALGLAVCALCSLWPLVRAAALPPVVLFRGQEGAATVPLGRWAWAALGALAVGIGLLSVLAAPRPGLAVGFLVMTVLTLGFFAGLARGLAYVGHNLPVRGFVPRLALTGLSRPGSTALSMMISLGVGLSVMTLLALVEGNLAVQLGHGQLGHGRPAQTPDFYVMDLSDPQLEALTALVTTRPGVTMTHAPMVRGRITRINGHDPQSLPIAAESQWAVRGDRGLTVAAHLPDATPLADGQWWPADYDGPPLVSLDAALAKGFGVGVGDSLHLNILGREMPVRIASTRHIHWASLSLNFALILSPHALDGAPMSHLVTISLSDGQDQGIEQTIVDSFDTASIVRVKDVLADLSRLTDAADQAVRLSALGTLGVGVLVLASAVLAGQRRRIQESVRLKVVGASRWQLLAAWSLEFAAIGLVAGLAALLVGSVGAWAITTQVLKLDWILLPLPALLSLLVSVLTAMMVGFSGTWAALAAHPAPHLRDAS